MPISPIWPAATAVNAEGSIEFHGRTAGSLLDEFGSPLYLIDTDEVVARARHFVRAAAEAFNTSTTHVSFAGKAFLSKEVVRLVTEAGMFVDTCTMGEMKIALAAGVPGRRLVLHGNNKSDEEIALAIEQGFAKIVIDEPDEPERVAAIARKLGKRARVMLRVTVGVHAGGHEYISTAHEDQKFGVPLLAFYCTYGDILSNLIWCGMMIELSYCAIRGLSYADTQTGAMRNMRWFHIGMLCFVYAEYLLWTAGCFWPDTSPASPTFWCDLLLTFAILGLLPATRRAVEA